MSAWFVICPHHKKSRAEAEIHSQIDGQRRMDIYSKVSKVNHHLSHVSRQFYTVPCRINTVLLSTNVLRQVGNFCAGGGHFRRKEHMVASLAPYAPFKPSGT